MTDQSPPPTPPASGRGVACTRATPRQGTSYMAFRHEPLDEDDPLLGFRPVPHKAARRNSIVPARQRAFIASLAECGIVSQAARSIGASMEALYKLRQKPGAEEFRAAWDAAIDRGVMRLEDTALARAIEGEERMVVSGGQVLGHETRFNENLVMFFLRNRRAARYDAQKEIGPGHPVYEKVRDAYEAEQNRINNDPARMAKISRSLEVKIAGWRQSLIERWEAQRKAAIEKEGGVAPRLVLIDRETGEILDRETTLAELLAAEKEQEERARARFPSPPGPGASEDDGEGGKTD